MGICICKSLHSSGVCCPYIWCHEKLLDNVCSVEVYLYALFVASPLELLSQTLYVGYHHGDIFVFVVGGGDIGVVVVRMLFFC